HGDRVLSSCAVETTETLVDDDGLDAARLAREVTTDGKGEADSDAELLAAAGESERRGLAVAAGLVVVHQKGERLLGGVLPVLAGPQREPEPSLREAVELAVREIDDGLLGVADEAPLQLLGPEELGEEPVEVLLPRCGLALRFGFGPFAKSGLKPI